MKAVSSSAVGAAQTCERQTTSAVMMVRPIAFGFNPEAGRSNHFASSAPLGGGSCSQARREFDELARRLRSAGVGVHCLEDMESPAKPDAVFLNNWITTHADGTVVCYPMASPNRRLERRYDDVAALLASAGFAVNRRVDLTASEDCGLFLEGTGSMVLDRPGRVAYACLSERTHLAVLERFAAELGYEVVAFVATDPAGRPIYHTNVMMSLGRRFAAICLEAVRPDQRTSLVRRLEASGRTIVDLTWRQIASFAANMLELQATSGDAILALSTTAYRNLDNSQRKRLTELAGELVHSPLTTIEHYGGGSARCMITEIHLPRVAGPDNVADMSAGVTQHFEV